MAKYLRVRVDAGMEESLDAIRRVTPPSEMPRLIRVMAAEALAVAAERIEAGEKLWNGDPPRLEMVAGSSRHSERVRREWAIEAILARAQEVADV